MFTMSRTKLTYCNNLHYSIWLKPDNSSPYEDEEHEEDPYDITILIHYIIEKEKIVKEECLIVEVDDEIKMYEDDDLRMWIDNTLREFGVGRRCVQLRKTMVNDLMKKVCNMGMNNCRCYCGTGRGPVIVMEIVELNDDLPPGFDD